MKTSRSITAASPPPAKTAPATSAAPASLNVRRGWTSFWFSAVDPVGLHRLRFLAGLLFLAWLVPLTGHQLELFSLNGWFDRTAYLEATDPNQFPGGAPAPIGWSLVYLFGTNTALLNVFWWVSVGVLVLFTFGVATRITAVLIWLIVVSFLATPAASFDADFLLAMLAFYLMIGYGLLGVWSALSGDATAFKAGFLWGRNRQPEAPSYAANLAVRLIQVHFAIVVVASGLHKLQFGDWWAGVGLWYPLHPPFTLNAQRMGEIAVHAERTLVILSIAQYTMLAWQLAFPAFAWRRRWRILLLGGGVVGWLGCIFVYGVPLFGPVYLIGCLSYLTPGEWHGLARLFSPAGPLAGWLRSRPGERAAVRLSGGR
jgi:hypothetical protein